MSVPGGEVQRQIAGRYRVDGPLGSGAMGTVWSGFDDVLQRRVAIKELKIPDGMPSGEELELRERMMREARALAGLSHPNVVTVFDVLDSGGEPLVVMELVPSRNLASAIGELGRLNRAQAAVVGFGTAAALRAAHRAGITHRDVKPGNVLISDDGRIKLTDFGIARNESDAPMTSAGLVLGSPAYIAPEVAAGQPVTPAADLWGLGATLFAAVEGRPPYDVNGDPVLTITEVVDGEVPQLSEPGPVSEVIAGLMVKEPADRMPLDEVRARLRPLLADPDDPIFPGSPDVPTIMARVPSGTGGSGASTARPVTASGPSAPPARRRARSLLRGGRAAREPAVERSASGASAPQQSGGGAVTPVAPHSAAPPAATPQPAAPPSAAPVSAAPLSAAPLSADPGPLPAGFSGGSPPPEHGSGYGPAVRQGPPQPVRPVPRPVSRPAPAPVAAPAPKVGVMGGIPLVIGGALIVLFGAAGGYAGVRTVAGQEPMSTVTVATERTPRVPHPDPLGFSVSVPENWSQYRYSTGRDTTVVRFVSPDGTEEISVRSAESSRAVTDGLTAAALGVDSVAAVAAPAPVEGTPGAEQVSVRTVEGPQRRTSWVRTIPGRNSGVWVVSLTTPSDRSQDTSEALFDAVADEFRITGS